MGGYRSRIEAAILKGMGTKPGIPDVIIIHQGRTYALELKAKGGRLSDRQLMAITAMADAGAATCVANGLDEALEALECWGILRGTAS